MDPRVKPAGDGCGARGAESNSAEYALQRGATAMTAHLDTFARDNLPPRAQWPDFLFELPELKYPERMNSVVELLDRWVAAGRGNPPCLISPTETLTYARLGGRVDRIADPLTRPLRSLAGPR